jgi:release factor glutamine methyltransferase
LPGSRNAAAGSDSVWAPGTSPGATAEFSADEIAGQQAQTVAALICEGTRALREAGIDNPRAEARLLLETASGLSREQLIAHPDRPIAAEPFRALLRRRMKREPMAYIQGEKEFFSLPFKVTPDVLIPRPDSECLIEAALAAFPQKDAALRVLDLGTGSGCLLLAFLSARPAASGIGIDRSENALRLAKDNACALGLAGRAQFLRADWLSALRGSFDVILANPPYIPECEIAALAPDVAAYEPRAALSGGADGLSAYRAILGTLGDVMGETSLALFEIGVGQADAVDAIAAARGLQAQTRVCDLAGRTRALLYRRTRDKKIVGMGCVAG